MSWSKAALAITLVLLMGCGFQPMYARQTGAPAVSDQLALIYVDSIENRTGQILRNHLLDRLTPLDAAAEARYRLSIDLRFSQESVALERDETVTRKNLTVTAGYILRDVMQRKTLTHGSVRTVAAFNVVQSDFATLSAERDAERRAVKELSEEITTRLAVFFTGQRAGGS